ncbi:MAG: hypothetical protein LC793_12260 [Thermomicrobia bacterium]|nr:hypothetical protein [Thermomicrobia bacterium]
MQALTGHLTISMPDIALFYLDSFEDGFGLPDGQFLVKYQTYEPLSGEPVGPLSGDGDPAYVRSYMREKYPRAIECRVVTAWSMVGSAVQR